MRSSLGGVVFLVMVVVGHAQTATLLCASTSSTGMSVNCDAVGGLCGSSTDDLDHVTWDSSSPSCPSFPTSNCTSGSGLECEVSSCLDTSWASWSDCSVHCGQGQNTRNRTVVVTPFVGTAYCVNLSVYQPCDTGKVCPEDDPLVPTSWLVAIGILVGLLFCLPLATMACRKWCPKKRSVRPTWRGRPTKSGQHKVFTDPAVVNRPRNKEPETNVVVRPKVVRSQAPGKDAAAAVTMTNPTDSSTIDGTPMDRKAPPVSVTRKKPTPLPPSKGKGVDLPVVAEDESIEVPMPTRPRKDPKQAYKEKQFDRGVIALGGRAPASVPNSARSMGGSTISSMTFVTRQ